MHHATGTADGTWDYINGITYHNGTIAFITTEEGRAKNNSGTYKYTYDLKDHLGNVRVTFDKNTSTGAAEVIQEDEYYAFGLRHGLYDNSNGNRYLYNKKELQDELTQYDYGARFYDPVIGRGTSVDPLSEKNRRFSPYNYVENNPIRYIDPDGMDKDDPVTAAMKKFTSEMKQVLSGSASLEWRVEGLGGSVKAGPLKAGIDVGVWNAKAKVENSTLKFEGSVVTSKVDLGLGGAKASAGVDFIKGTAEVPLGKGPMKGEIKVIDSSATVSKGSITVNNSSELGGSLKVGPATVEGTVHLDHAAAAAGSLYTAGYEYLKQKTSEIMHPQVKVLPENQ
ncbi:RHS repeat domain-containing protein [Mucilaginibacter jinjuensis]|uniref:RHS repeat-associated core domain-containing protein n=1 Tax=Mucilaginibacter jinjuensis TaxID=1176721 RepID=A0ABY7TBU4_9SPHI|nr:RHS repeat-associated core domain-containing protein [Mucilaginibacter jinjuensis]WCT13678.1 RHS repeat-associated core domain-containing protein [Mucilaginibacter jinjuensis]